MTDKFYFMKIPRKKLILAVILVVGLIIIVFLVSSKKPKDVYSTATVISGPLVQTVNETGTIKAAQEVALNFLSTGCIDQVLVKVGDEVEVDTPLISLESESLELRKIEAEAGLKIAQANLSKLYAGASGETVAVSRSELEQAQANESAARTDLEKTKKSVAENYSQAEKTLRDLESRDPSNITPQEQAVSLAQTALDNAKLSGTRSVDSAGESALLTFSDKILSGKIALDNLNTILTDNEAKNLLGVLQNGSLVNTKNNRLQALNMIAETEAAVQLARSSKTSVDINAAGNKVRAFLTQTSLTLNYAYSMLEATITSASFPQSSLDAYKTLVSTQSAQVSAANNAVEAALQAYNNSQTAYSTSVASAEENLRQAQVNLESAILTARNNLISFRLSGDQQISAAQARLDSAIQSVTTARARLNNVIAPARAQDIALAEAQISQAQANLANIEKQIADSVLKAPLKGIVTEINYDVGEQFGVTGQPAVKMLANNNFEIEVDISESDINKIKIGDETTVTVDAFSDDLVFSGKVVFIEPAQTLAQDVVYYRVKIEFTELNKINTDLASRGLALKSGMTTNLIITTDKRETVLQVPARAIIEKDGQKIVRVLENQKIREAVVSTGLRGDEGLIEILSGLHEGEEVITFIKNGD